MSIEDSAKFQHIVAKTAGVLRRPSRRVRAIGACLAAPPTAS
jgi:hypothetical protein